VVTLVCLSARFWDADSGDKPAGFLLFVLRLLLFRWKAILHGNKLQDLGRRHGEPVGELEKAIKRYGLLGSLNSADLITVKVTHLRKLLLGEMPFNP
jgi:hypothetical protein